MQEDHRRRIHRMDPSSLRSAGWDHEDSNSRDYPNLPFVGPEDGVEPTLADGQAVPIEEVRVKLGEVFPLLADALGKQRSWLDDFAEEEVSISVDLHDVLEAYRNFWRDAA